jgi:hypothetical protein
MKNDEKTINLLKKLKELSERGIGGEKDNAARMLEKLMKKHGLTFDDLAEEEIKEIELEYHNAEEAALIRQVVYKVLGTSEAAQKAVFVYRYGKGKRSKKLIRCTPSEAAQIILLYNFYRDLWETERAKLFEAFIQRNSIFGKSTEEEKEDSRTPEEIAELIRLMSMFKKANVPAYQLEAGEKQGG